MEVGTVTYVVYEKNKEYKDLTNVVLPNRNAIVTTVSGAGIAGNMEVAFQGLFDAMTLSITRRMTTPENEGLTKPGIHVLEIREAAQYLDEKTGSMKTRAIKHILQATVKNVSGGTVAPASTKDAQIDYSVSYWATYYDGKKTSEIDQGAFICTIDGVDLLKSVRKALGK